MEGNRIADSVGNQVMLRGVNRSGTEYQCIHDNGFFEGPDDEASVQAITTWNATAVRVPLNESCWLGINGAPEAYSGCAYKNAIKSYVDLLHKYDLVPLLDLHWSGPGVSPAERLQPMPNAEHTGDFWRDVAQTFKGDEGVVLELFNEPFPDLNQDTDEAWSCWLDGCDVEQVVDDDEPPASYRSVGMQSLVNVVRSTDSRHLLLLGGVQYSNGLSQWLARKPVDPRENLAAAWHVYNNNPCRDADCWNGAPAEVAAAVPLVATEIGQNDCAAEFVTPLLDWLDQHAAGYLAWTWWAFGACVPPMPMQRPRPWSLVTDYYEPLPNSAYAQAFYDRLQQFPR